MRNSHKWTPLNRELFEAGFRPTKDYCPDCLAPYTINFYLEFIEGKRLQLELKLYREIIRRECYEEPIDYEAMSITELYLTRSELATVYPSSLFNIIKGKPNKKRLARQKTKKNRYYKTLIKTKYLSESSKLDIMGYETYTRIKRATCSEFPNNSIKTPTVRNFRTVQ